MSDMVVINDGNWLEHIGQYVPYTTGIDAARLQTHPVGYLGAWPGRSTCR